mgnify:CR=1 FL=1
MIALFFTIVLAIFFAKYFKEIMLLFGVGAYRIAKMGKLALKLHQDSKAEKERLKKEEELKNPKVPPLKVIGYFLLCLLGVLLLALVSNVIHNGGRLG